MENITITYPLYYQCSNKAAFEALNQQANNLLGYSNESADTYALPIIDKYGKYWFIVNPEVSELVDLTKCVPFEEIEFNTTL